MGRIRTRASGGRVIAPWSHRQKRIVRLASVVAMFFGGLTIVSGGLALFGSGTTRTLFGDVVQPVLWFNFLSGFAYALAGTGMRAGKRWSVWLSATIFLSILCSGIVLGLHIVDGGAYEVRTVAAMIVRGATWFTISWIAMLYIGWAPET